MIDKNKIEELCKRENININYDEDIERLFSMLDLPFTLSMSSYPNDYFLEASYYSDKINKRIVIDEDVKRFNDVESIVSFINDTIESITQLEESIKIIKK